MIKKLEAWFRSIISAELAKVIEEVAKVQVSLESEKNALLCDFQVLDDAVKTHFATIGKEVSRIVAENAALKAKVYELQHSRWQPSLESVAADHALKVTK